jgi:hypothetical protein
LAETQYGKIMKNDKGETKREQLNGRVDARVAQGVRLVAAAHRGKDWTQDRIIECALKVLVFGCDSEQTRKMAKEVRAAAKQLSLASFDDPDHQPGGMQMAA